MARSDSQRTGRLADSPPSARQVNPHGDLSFGVAPNETVQFGIGSHKTKGLNRLAANWGEHHIWGKRAKQDLNKSIKN
jgi:hypothetical protein